MEGKQNHSLAYHARSDRNTVSVHQAVCSLIAYEDVSMVNRKPIFEILKVIKMNQTTQYGKKKLK